MIKGKITRSFILFSLLSIACFAQGQISVESKVDSSEIFIGDEINYSVTVRHTPEVNVDMPSLAENLGMFELRDYNVLEPQKQNDHIVERTNYVISTFDTGEFQIPELTIGYTVGDDTTRQTIKTEPIDIVVNSLNPDEAGDIRDIKPPLTPPRDYRSLATWIGLGLLGVAVVLFLIYYIKRRRAGEPILPKRIKPPRPAHEVAFDELDELKNSDLLENAAYKTHYSRLSEIVRRYIENRYFIAAMEMTTFELLTSLETEQLHTEEVDMLRDLLTRCDLVKFARFEPAQQEHEQSFQQAFNFVDRTKMVLSEPEDETRPEKEESASQAEVTETESVEEVKDV